MGMRVFVLNFQEQNRELKENQQEATAQAQVKSEVTSAAIMEMPDFRSRLESTKAHAKVRASTSACVLNLYFSEVH